MLLSAPPPLEWELKAEKPPGDGVLSALFVPYGLLLLLPGLSELLRFSKKGLWLLPWLEAELGVLTPKGVVSNRPLNICIYFVILGAFRRRVRAQGRGGSFL